MLMIFKNDDCSCLGLPSIGYLRSNMNVAITDMLCFPAAESASQPPPYTIGSAPSIIVREDYMQYQSETIWCEALSSRSKCQVALREVPGGSSCL